LAGFDAIFAGGHLREFKFAGFVGPAHPNFVCVCGDQSHGRTGNGRSLGGANDSGYQERWRGGLLSGTRKCEQQPRHKKHENLLPVQPAVVRSRRSHGVWQRHLDIIASRRVDALSEPQHDSSQRTQQFQRFVAGVVHPVRAKITLDQCFARPFAEISFISMSRL
jgi:hypothetical protein